MIRPDVRFSAAGLDSKLATHKAMVAATALRAAP